MKTKIIRKVRKVLPIILALTMVLGLVPFSLAEDGDDTGDELVFSTSGNEVSEQKRIDEYIEELELELEAIPGRELGNDSERDCTGGLSGD